MVRMGSPGTCHLSGGATSTKSLPTSSNDSPTLAITSKINAGLMPCSSIVPVEAAQVGENTEDWAGYAVSSAGDVNGDGFDDLIVGAFGDDAGGSNAGAAYVVFGQAGGFGTVNLDDVALGSGGFKIVGESADDRAGISVSGAGDVNGDGIDDLVIGDWTSNGGDSAAYVIYGSDPLII